MKQTIDVLCIGDSVMDTLVGPVDSSIFTRDMTYVDNIVLFPGGDAQNQARALGRLNVNAGIYAVVGNDPNGHNIKQGLEKHNVNVDYLLFREDIPTLNNIVVVHRDANRSLISSAIRAELKPEDMDLSVIEQVNKAVSYASFFISPEFDVKAPEIFKFAKARELLVFADTVQNRKKTTLDYFYNSFQYIDYFFPNLEEGMFFSGQEDLDAICDFFINKGIKTVVLKLGAQGCLIKSKAERIYVPGFKIEALDTTGSGDNFAAGFISAVLEGLDLEEAAIRANATGAMTAQNVGSENGYCNLSEVLDFIKKNTKSL
ncbi:MAG TPA: carbohydrate kinase family protein [Clostridiaceae bacterium]|jgi:sugar/nucleoside kinase (ribokinase family)|nr:carbohydrate kinase family protein [Clostridiaceae bacterium]